MDQNSLEKNLFDLHIPAIRYFHITTSTNADALQWASEGALDGSLVVADQQTAGRGRLGRKWITTAGASLAFSLVFRPNEEENQHLAWFSPLGALAVNQAIQEFCHLSAWVKWPNDVLLNRKKVCGVLAESAWQNDCLIALILGIGINISTTSIPKETELIFPASCLEDECGMIIDRERFLKAVLTSLFNLRTLLVSNEFIPAWENRLAFKGENICLETPNGETLSGSLAGLDVCGNLRLKLDSGIEKVFPIGDVKLRPQEK